MSCTIIENKLLNTDSRGGEQVFIVSDNALVNQYTYNFEYYAN